MLEPLTLTHAWVYFLAQVSQQAAHASFMRLSAALRFSGLLHHTTIKFTPSWAMWQEGPPSPLRFPPLYSNKLVVPEELEPQSTSTTLQLLLPLWRMNLP